MSMGPKKADFSTTTDKELADLAKQKGGPKGPGGQFLGHIGQSARDELKKRKKGRHDAKVKELDKQRESTIDLLKARPGRDDSIKGSGSNNPFRL